MVPEEIIRKIFDIIFENFIAHLLTPFSNMIFFMEAITEGNNFRHLSISVRKSNWIGQNLVKIYSKTRQNPLRIPIKSPQSILRISSESPQNPLRIPSESPQIPLRIPSESPQNPFRIPSESPQKSNNIWIFTDKMKMAYITNKASQIMLISTTFCLKVPKSLT